MAVSKQKPTYFDGVITKLRMTSMRHIDDRQLYRSTKYVTLIRPATLIHHDLPAGSAVRLEKRLRVEFSEEHTLMTYGLNHVSSPA